MFCKFRAARAQPAIVPSNRRPSVLTAIAGRAAPAAVLLLLVAGAPMPAQAERADRNKPLVMEADRPGILDYQRQVLVFNGNAVITQGTMVLRAERIELREMPDGYRAATAIGAGAGKPATWRQRRDGVDETVEGSADRIEFDGRADTLRFVGNGAVRRLRGATVSDEITGSVIVWDNTTEVFKVEGGAASPANPAGRVRVILSPRAESASAPAPGGNRPATAPLAPSRGIEPGSR